MLENSSQTNAVICGAGLTNPRVKNGEVVRLSIEEHRPNFGCAGWAIHLFSDSNALVTFANSRSADAALAPDFL
jgi:hypothetical protein